jgi:hypothetical protein
VAPPDKAAEGWVSLWVSLDPLIGVPHAYLEGGDELFAWLDVEFGVAIDGAFSTNFTRHGDLVALERLLSPLVGADAFGQAAQAEARRRGWQHFSFVVALYDLRHEPPEGDDGSDQLRFLGAFKREA